MSLTVRVKRNDIPRLVKDWQSTARQVLQEHSYDLEAQMKKNVIDKNIIDTGALLNSTQVQRFEDDGLTSYTGPSVEYAIHQEYGTTRQPGRPFVRPAFDLVAPRFLADLKARLQP